MRNRQRSGSQCPIATGFGDDGAPNGAERKARGSQLSCVVLDIFEARIEKGSKGSKHEAVDRVVENYRRYSAIARRNKRLKKSDVDQEKIRAQAVNSRQKLRAKA